MKILLISDISSRYSAAETIEAVLQDTRKCGLLETDEFSVCVTPEQAIAALKEDNFDILVIDIPLLGLLEDSRAALRELNDMFQGRCLPVAVICFSENLVAAAEIVRGNLRSYICNLDATSVSDAVARMIELVDEREEAVCQCGVEPLKPQPPHRRGNRRGDEEEMVIYSSRWANVDKLRS